jgi:hypothetical protein
MQNGTYQMMSPAAGMPSYPGSPMSIQQGVPAYPPMYPPAAPQMQMYQQAPMQMAPVRTPGDPVQLLSQTPLPAAPPVASVDLQAGLPPGITLALGAAGLPTVPTVAVAEDTEEDTKL